MFSLIFNNLRLWGAIAAIIGALLGGLYYGKQQYTAGYLASGAEWQAKTNAIKAEATTKLAAETARVLEVEHEAQRAANTATSGLLTRNARILGDRNAAIDALNSKLRNSKPGCGADSDSAPTPDNSPRAIAATPGGVWVSETGARSIIDLAAEADQLHAQYVAIQSYLVNIGMSNNP